MAQRSLAKRLWYGFLHVTCRLGSVIALRIRCEGRHHLPQTGGALILANHQSYLDPVLIGVAADRRLNYLARKTLFRFFLFRWLIESLDAIPIDREGSGMQGLKETLRRLKQQEIVLIFPEGTRTPDGEVHPLKPGFCALAKRAKVPLVPLALEGSYDCWPRGQALPRLATLQVQFGEPIQPEEIARYDDRELVEEVERRIRACHAEARHKRAARCVPFLDEPEPRPATT